MTIGDPIPRGDISRLKDNEETMLVDYSAANHDGNDPDAPRSNLEALYAEIEHLQNAVIRAQQQAATQIRSLVRERPLTSLIGALAVGYITALLTHQAEEKNTRRR